MAKKKKNKTEQTFNVYPYLGGYQHFMRNGGALPKFEETGTVDPSVVAKRIKPRNKYKYANTWSGVVDEWQAINDPNYVPRGNMMGQVANLIGSSIDFGKNVIGAFDKDNYKPGGKYSKIQTRYVAGRCSDPQYTTQEDCTTNGQKWTEGQDVYDGLKYANQTITNTTDDVATLHMENLDRWNKMSKREKKKFIEDGGRNTDLWWTPDEMAEGKWNYMDIDPNTGLPRYDGINLRASTMRADALEDLTGDRMFSNKTKVKQPDGSYKFVYFDEHGNIAKSQVPTEYDRIEEGTGTGELGDANVTHMNIDFQSNEDLLNIPGVVMGPDGYPIYGETGERVIPKNKLTSFDHYVQDEDGTFKYNKNVEYDPNKYYGEYTDVERRESDLQAINECEGGITCPGGVKGVWVPDETGGSCNCNGEVKYGKEIPSYLRGGGTAQEAVLCDAYDKPIDPAKAWAADTVNNYKGPGMNNDSDKINRGLWKYGGGLDKFVYGGTLPKAQDGAECTEPVTGCPDGQSWDAEACTCKGGDAEININNMNQSPYVYNDPNNPMANFDINANAEPPIMVADESENSPAAQPRVLNQYELLGMDDPTNRQAKEGFTCSDGKSTTREECEANGGTWNDPNDMGIDNNYGQGPLQKTWNKSREFLNTGVMGAAQDVLVGQSAEQYCSDPQYKTKEECEKNGAKWTETKGTGLVSLLYDNVMPIAHNILGQNAEHKADLYKRSVSAEDVYAATEAGVGAGQRGFHDINKGGFGDDLYGTGKIFGQTAQQGVEMPPQNQKDFSTVLKYMNQENGLRFNLDLLEQQKGYLGQMNMGGEPDIAKAIQAKSNPMGAVVTALQDGTAKNSMNAWFSGDMNAWANAGPSVAYGAELPKFQGDDGSSETDEMKEMREAYAKVNVDHFVPPNEYIDPSTLPAGVTAVGSDAFRTSNSLTTIANDGEANYDYSGSYITNDRNSTAGGADNVVVNRNVLGKLFNRRNVRDADITNPRDVRKIEEKFGMSIDELLASGRYKISDDGKTLTNTPYVSSMHSTTRRDNVNTTFDDIYGTFILPNEANKHQGGFGTSVTKDGNVSYDQEAETYWKNIGQYSKGDDNIYSDPRYRGSFLPEVIVKGAYGGQLPKANEGTESKPWYSKFADYTQTALSGVGLTPGPVGFVADAINTGISGTRTAYNAAIGDDEAAKMHTENLALNAASMVPGPTGWVAGGTALAKDTANYAGITDSDKSVTTQVTEAVTDKKPPLVTENMGEDGPKKIGDTAKYGKETANIDMDLYYELLRAGADIKIIR